MSCLVSSQLDSVNSTSLVRFPCYCTYLDSLPSSLRNNPAPHPQQKQRSPDTATSSCRPSLTELEDFSRQASRNCLSGVVDCLLACLIDRAERYPSSPTIVIILLLLFFLLLCFRRRLRCWAATRHHILFAADRIACSLTASPSISQVRLGDMDGHGQGQGSFPPLGLV